MALYSCISKKETKHLTGLNSGPTNKVPEDEFCKF